MSTLHTREHISENYIKRESSLKQPLEFAEIVFYFRR